MNSRLLLSVLATTSLTMFPSFGETMNFSYNAFGEKPSGFGYKKAEVYDMAIRLADAELIGKKITGFRVAVIGDTESISDYRGWLTEELTSTTKDNTSLFTPDIISVEGTLEDGLLSVVFASPYEIPENGIYIGYSFSMDKPADDSQKPVAVIDGNAPGGFWFHSSITQKSWADMAKRNGIVSTITVALEGEFKTYAASPLIEEGLRIANEESTHVPIEISNWGLSGISSIDYSWKIADIEGHGTYNFAESVPSELGSTGIAMIELEPIAGKGEATLSLIINQVNGEENSAYVPQTNSPVIIQKFVPNYRPLVEEYTGLNCGCCPRGYVMLEEMKEEYGDEFVGLSYHSPGWENDAMDCIKNEDFPVNPSAYPAASLNRNQTVDPSDIPSLWKKCYRNKTPGEVRVNWEWTDEQHSTLKATAKARFLNDIAESDYRIAFVMLADGLSNPKWVQANYYADYTPSDYYSGQFWDLFIGKDSHLTGLRFNDIVVYATDYKGLEESLPQQINSGEWYEFSLEINPDDITNLNGTHIVENFHLTRMVAMIVDGKSGKPLNCISSSYPDNSTAINAANLDLSIVSTEWYDLQGHRLQTPSKGMFIKIDTLSDGNRKVIKVII